MCKNGTSSLQLNIYKNDFKKFWKCIAEMFSYSKPSPSNFLNIHDDDIKIVSQENLASQVNCFFSDIGLKLDKAIPHIQTQQIADKALAVAHTLNRFKRLIKYLYKILWY